MPLTQLSYSPILGVGQKCIRILFSNYPFNPRYMVFVDFVLVLRVQILLQQDNITARSNLVPKERVLLGGRCGCRGEELTRLACRRVQARGCLLDVEDAGLGITGRCEYRAVRGVWHELYAEDVLCVARVYARVQGEVWIYGVDVGQSVRTAGG